MKNSNSHSSKQESRAFRPGNFNNTTRHMLLSREAKEAFRAIRHENDAVCWHVFYLESAANVRRRFPISKEGTKLLHAMWLGLAKANRHELP